MEKTLIEYVRVARGPKKGQLKGVVVAHSLTLGWSCVNTEAGDVFDKKLSVKIALDRCDVGTNHKMPYDVAKVMARMVIRRDKYFKGLPDVSPETGPRHPPFAVV